MQLRGDKRRIPMTSRLRHLCDEALTGCRDCEIGPLREFESSVSSLASRNTNIASKYSWNLLFPILSKICLSNNHPRLTLKYKSVFYNKNFGSGMRAYPIRHAMKHEQALSERLKILRPTLIAR
jgi:hypothetical protein